MIDQVRQAGGVLGVAEQGRHGAGVAPLGPSAELVEAMLADQAVAAPGTVANKIDTMFNLLDGRLGKPQPEIVGQKLH